MSGRSWRTRFWTALMLLLSPMLGQALHEHPAHDVPKALAGCDDSGPHLAGHADAPDLCHPADDCPACRSRADTLAYLESPGQIDRIVSRPESFPDDEPAITRPRQRASSRAPPRV